jgi:hypothetical protein
MNAPLVDTRQFIGAIRDAGYKSSAFAIAELVDNSIEAQSTNIEIIVEEIAKETGGPVRIQVIDDGHGMSKAILRTALQFGGSSRFDSRKGTGRFGMGLPNSSVSQARRVDVYTWQGHNRVLWSYLDVDEIADGVSRSVPEPVRRVFPSNLTRRAYEHGTVVVWTRCDRLSHRRLSTLVQSLHQELGRIFRVYIHQGVSLFINGIKLSAIDPLFIRGVLGKRGAKMYGPPLVYEMKLAPGTGTTSRIEVVFSELPVKKWASLNAVQKRQRSITKQAGISILRANREIDSGWFFMGSKRKENYDDWWRCELRFDPDLDEEFGVTHTKQGVRPTERIKAVLTPEIEKIAHRLNARVRQAFMKLKASEPCSSVRRANDRDILLEPPRMIRGHYAKSQDSISDAHGLRYRIAISGVSEEEFFFQSRKGSQIIVTLNSDHPFFRRFYSLFTSDANIDADLAKTCVDLTLLAAARAHCEWTTSTSKPLLDRFRRSWSNNLAAFLT